MQHKIPPPLVTLFFGLCIYFSKYFLPAFAIDYGLYIGAGFELLGIGILLASALAFSKQKTTVNPLKPDTATSLVVQGMFKFSRNPMYLGMLLVLVGVALQFNTIGGVIFIPLFMLYLTYFQIIPEEEAMLKLFGEEFSEYRKQVRRWL